MTNGKESFRRTNQVRSLMKLSLPFRAIVTLNLLVCAGAAVCADDPKVICATHADTPPVIDGILDDSCWGQAEVRDDFLGLGQSALPRTTMRFAYDSQHLYLAVECWWNESSRLRRRVESIRATPGFAEGFVDISHFTNDCSVELFLDPGATMRNHYQLLCNAAGQICGQFKGDWDPFSKRPVCGVNVTDVGWSAEVVFSDQGIRQHDLRLGSEWGVNLVRNDEGPVSIWKDVGAVFNEPKQFGRLIIGDYASWWRGVWENGVVRRYAEISESMEKSESLTRALLPLYQEVGQRMRSVEATTRDADLTTRAGFLKVYARYTELHAVFHRLDALYSTIRLVGGR